MNSAFIQYQIGLKSYTKKMPISIDSIDFLNKQFSISLPLITGAILSFPQNKEVKILVGQELNLLNIARDKYSLEKYDLDINDLADLALQGYKKACLLNYKKYEQMLVGINKDDYIVSDYQALKKTLNSIANNI